MQNPRFGCIQDRFDQRDYSVRTPAVETAIARTLGADVPANPPVGGLPGAVDNRKWCSPTTNQIANSCTAEACASLMEYCERRASGNHLDVSRLFIYRESRICEGITGDVGSTLRSSLRVLATLGAPPETMHPYQPELIDIDPSSRAYAYAASCKAETYYRINPPGMAPHDVLGWIKVACSMGFAVVLGFEVFGTINSIGKGNIPYPSPSDESLGCGHAVMVCGYHDGWKITNTTGALLIQNSWGVYWGGGGFGYLPYEYVLQNKTWDIWSVISLRWVDSGNFGM